MNKTRFVLLLMLMLSAVACTLSGQTFNRRYTGVWGGLTFWEFIFSDDGTFVRNSEGHFGNTVAAGTYQIYSDTLEILKGFEGTAGTVNRLYLLEGDSMLIDIALRYDYKRDSVGKWLYGSKERKRISAIWKSPSGTKSDTIIRLVPSSSQYMGADIEICATYFNFPTNFPGKTGLFRPKELPAIDPWFRTHQYDNRGRLITVIYGDTALPLPPFLTIFYQGETGAIAKIVDSADQSYYEVYYKPELGGISVVVSYSAAGKRRRMLAFP